MDSFLKLRNVKRREPWGTAALFVLWMKNMVLHKFSFSYSDLQASACRQFCLMHNLSALCADRSQSGVKEPKLNYTTKRRLSRSASPAWYERRSSSDLRQASACGQICLPAKVRAAVKRRLPHIFVAVTHYAYRILCSHYRDQNSLT